MRTSTILVVGTLGLIGAGAYFYLKGKKTPTVASIADDTLGLAPTKDDTKLLADLGVKTEEPKATPYVKPVEGVPLLTAENLQKALLALNIGTTSSNQTRSITELTSPNYKEALSLASKISGISRISVRSGNYVTPSQGKTLSDYYGSAVGFETNCYTIPSGRGRVCSDYKLRISKDEMLKNMTAKLNALGYKILPDFSIEKM
jgi:hypothetical protein